MAFGFEGADDLKRVADTVRYVESLPRSPANARLRPRAPVVQPPNEHHVRVDDDTATTTVDGVTYYAAVVLGYAYGVASDHGDCWVRRHDDGVPAEDTFDARLAGLNLADGLPLFVAIAGSAGGGGGSGTLTTVEEDDGSPSVANAEVLQFDDEWFAVTEPVAGTALVKGAFMKKIATRVMLRF